MRIIAGIAMLLCPFFTFAQHPGKKVTMVLSTNDTIRGYINDKEWLTNPSKVEIKEQASGTYKEYKPEEVKSIKITGGDFYFSATIKIDNTPSEFEGPVFEESLINFKEKQVFLLAQFSSPELSLYSYYENNRLHLYTQKGSENPAELIYRKYTVRRANGIFELEDKTFINQLSALLQPCDRNTGDLSTLVYEKGDVRNYFYNYYKNCSKETDIYINKQRGKGAINISLITGISKTFLSFKSNNTNTGYTNVTTVNPLKAAPSFSAGIRISSLLPRLHRKLSISGDIYYNSFNATVTEYKSYTSPSQYILKTLSVNPAYIHTNLGAKFYLNRENSLRPFLQAGVSYAVMLSDKSEMILDDYYNNASHVTTGSPFGNNELKKASFGGFAGIGISFKKFGLDYRFEPLGALTYYSFVSSSLSTHTILISYQLTNN